MGLELWDYIDGLDCSFLVTEHFCFWCFFWFDSVAVCEIFWFLLLPLQDFRSPHARPEDKNSAPSAHPHLRELYEGSSRQLHTQMERLSKAQIGRLGRRVSIHQMAGGLVCASMHHAFHFTTFSWYYYSDKNVWCNQKLEFLHSSSASDLSQRAAVLHFPDNQHGA